MFETYEDMVTIDDVLVKISALLGHSSIHTTFEFYCETMNDEASIRDFMNMKFVPGGEA